jgi:DNA-binding transcriptional MerR regulator
MTDMTFGKKTAIALTGVTGRQLEHWAVTGIVRPSVKAAAGKGSRREYSFKDLVALKLAKRLRDEGISLQKIRKSLAWLRRHFPEVAAPLAELRFLTNGVDLFVLDRDPEKILDTLKNGQLVIALALGELIEDLQGDLRKLVIPKEEKIRVAGRTFTVILTLDRKEEGFTVQCLEEPATVSRGETEQEALDNLVDLLERLGLQRVARQTGEPPQV